MKNIILFNKLKIKMNVGITKKMLQGLHSKSYEKIKRKWTH